MGDTLIHCTHGADRTGGYISRAKIEMDGVDPKAAQEDAVSNYGMDPCPDNKAFHAWLGLPC